jgi:hypothetical protein
VLFTPGYLFGAAARRRPVVATSDGGEAVATDEPWLSRRAMVVLGCVILGVFGLLMGYIVLLLLSTGGDRTL